MPNIKANYLEAVDLIIQGISERFNQPSSKIIVMLENILLEGTVDNNFVTIYRDEVNIDALKVEIDILRAQPDHPTTINQFIKSFKKNSFRLQFQELGVVLRLLLLLPASNASSERSFSALKRLKTTGRSTMTQARLSNLIMLHVHKPLTDTIDIQHIIKSFVSCHPRRANSIAVYV